MYPLPIAYEVTILLTTLVSVATLVGLMIEDALAERRHAEQLAAEFDLGPGAAAIAVRANAVSRRRRRQGALKAA